MSMLKTVSCIMVMAAFLSGCGSHSWEKGRDFRLKEVSYSALRGFENDNFKESYPALMRSCQKADAVWRDFCRGLPAYKNASSNEIRAYIQDKLTPYAVISYGKNTGRMTGYYEAELTGTRHKTYDGQVPVYGLPYGYEYGDKLKTRARIEKDKHFDAPIIAWADDPVELFILHVQGSGRMVTPEGEIKLGYAGNNGQPFKGIGTILAEEGVASEHRHSMSDIKAYLQDHPDEAKELMSKNPRYIFFQEKQGETPYGAGGVVLTPKRSVAVDPAYIPMHTPMWLSSQWPSGQEMNRLVVAQDKGTAIKGGIRSDFFFGHGAGAFYDAGRMNKQGRYFLLLPKDLD